MKRIMLLSVLLSSIIFLLAKDILWISESEKGFASLTFKDFSRQIETGETIDARSDNIAVAIHIDSFDQTDYYFFMNGSKIRNFFDECRYDFTNKVVFYSIRDLLQEGVNDFQVYYPDGTNHSWYIRIDKANTLSYDSHKQITSGRGWKMNPAISPNDNLVAYTVSGESYNAINVFNLETEKTFRIVENKKNRVIGEIDEEHYYSSAPCWSCDGTKLFYVSNHSGNNEIYRADVSYEGDVSNHTQMTEFNSYIGSIVSSPSQDAIYFLSKKDGTMAVYRGIQAEAASGSRDFMKGVERISPDDGGVYFSPAISRNDQYIAFCRNDSHSKTSINIYSLNDLRLIKEISAPIGNVIYPSWSSENDLLAYYYRKELRVFNLNSESDFAVCTQVRIPQGWSVKPFWARNRDAIYYIADDKNSAIHLVEMNQEGNGIENDYVVLDDKRNANNYEVVVTADVRNMIRCSFQEGYDLWLDSSKGPGKNTESIAAFRADNNSMVKVWNKYDKKFSLLALCPEVYMKNAYLEKEGLKAGNHRFMIGDRNFNSNLVSDFKTFESSSVEKRNFSLKYGLYSAILPSYGQYSSKNLEKSNFFRYSFWGLAALTAGSFYYADQLHSDYQEQTEIKNTIETRDQYMMVSSIASGLLIGTVANYLLNVIDATTSERNVIQEYREQHDRNFHQVNSKLPTNRYIYAKKLSQKGELKILTRIPNMKLSLIDANGNMTDYGRTSLIFDRDTYFTVADLEPGNYILVSEDTKGNRYQDPVVIERNKVNYTTLKYDDDNGDFGYYLRNMIPGYVQLKRNEKTKAATIIGFTAASLLGAAYCHVMAENSYSEYQDAKTASDATEYRGDYVKYSNLRSTFFVTFSISYLYGLLDSSLR